MRPSRITAAAAACVERGPRTREAAPSGYKTTPSRSAACITTAVSSLPSFAASAIAEPSTASIDHPSGSASSTNAISCPFRPS
jgi:hypothetical protein